MALEVSSSAAVETLAAANWMAYNRQAEIVDASVADVRMVAVEKLYSKASVGGWMGMGVLSLAAVAVALVIMLDVVNWATIKRLDECRFIAAVVRVVVKAVVLAAVVAAVVTVAEVKDKMVIRRAGESGMTAIICVLGGRTVIIMIVLIVVIIFVVMLEELVVVIFRCRCLVV